MEIGDKITDSLVFINKCLTQEEVDKRLSVGNTVVLRYKGVLTKLTFNGYEECFHVGQSCYKCKGLKTFKEIPGKKLCNSYNGKTEILSISDNNNIELLPEELFVI